MSHLLSSVTTFVGRGLYSRAFQALPSAASNIYGRTAIQNPWSFDQHREAGINVKFIPNERKRVKKHGWYTKLATRNGRNQIMRRILKGRYVLTH